MRSASLPDFSNAFSLVVPLFFHMVSKFNLLMSSGIMANLCELV